MSNVIPVETVRSLSKSQLISYLQRGILTLEMTQDIDLTPNREELPEYQKFSNLSGKPIHISKGARKYKIPHGTISRWVKRGLIKTVGVDKNRVLIDEQDLAYCAWVRHERSKGSDTTQGKWLFDGDGLPYVPETNGG